MYEFIRLEMSLSGDWVPAGPICIHPRHAVAIYYDHPYARVLTTPGVVYTLRDPYDTVTKCLGVDT
jgi:hypothetical protein